MDKETVKAIKLAQMDRRKREFEAAKRKRKEEEEERLRALAQQVSANDS